MGELSGKTGPGEQDGQQLVHASPAYIRAQFGAVYDDVRRALGRVFARDLQRRVAWRADLVAFLEVAQKVELPQAAFDFPGVGQA